MSFGDTICKGVLPSLLSPMPFTEEQDGESNRKYRENRVSSPGDGSLPSSDSVSGKSLNCSNPSKYNLLMSGGEVGSL